MKKKKKFASIIKNHERNIEVLKKKIRHEEIPGEVLKEQRYFRSLLEITRSINTPRDFDQLLELIVDSAMILSRAERGFLMLFNREGNLEFRVTRNIDRKTVEEGEFKISQTVVNNVLETSKPLFLSDIYKNKKFKISKSIKILALHMVMCVPLKVQERLLGVIYVDSHTETERFTKIKERIFEAFAAQASVAIESSYLYDSSVRDMLTGLYNYGYLRSRLEEEIMRTSGHRKECISLLIFDVDNFKLINDSYGHHFGNSVLVKIAHVIKGTVRKYDVPARYGGDEIAILMPDTNVQNVQLLARQIRKKVADLKFSIGAASISITTSVGISIFPITQIIDGERVFVEADHALLIAKSKGGNQIAIFSVRKDGKKYEPELIGVSQAIDEVKAMASRLAKTDITILIIGETGTGKELITRLIHQKSVRSDKPFVVLNCGAIPDSLLESELFGYEKGAFTGAYRQHRGKFEVAHGGTVFLDEIGELPLHLQVKILRVLEQKEIDRIGGKTPIKVDVRIIAATNKNLEDEVKKGNFRKDLYYRLAVATIYIPPLKERPADIDSLGNYYLEQLNRRYGRNFLGFSETGKEAMIHYSWPGNVRELIHRIERAVIMSTGQYLGAAHLGLETIKQPQEKTLRESRDEVEKETIVQALKDNDWNITHTSKRLGITRKALRYLIKKHEIIKTPHTHE